MFGPLTNCKMQTYVNFSQVLYFPRDVRRICIFLTACFLFRVETLDIDSTVCRCTTTTKFGKPFVVLWNSPTEGCHVNFSVNIELDKYGILTNGNQTWNGEVVTVFYNAQLGLYPYYRNEEKQMEYNGGLPQLVNLTEHLSKASQHIAKKIPEPNYSGLAVIDWEGWRPLWDTNFGKKRLYQTESIALVKKEGILRKKRKIEREAKKRFSRAGKRLMEETIELGKKLRPRALWGFYGFPSCHGNISRGNHCTKKNKKWNSKLRWLYKRSTALFPSIYLMDDHDDNGKFVAEKLTEAFRVSRMTARPVYGHDLPVFPYLRPLYHYGARQFKMLTENDLEHAVGQTVNYGSAGLILWGNHYDGRTSREICLKYNNYVNSKLGPYISLLTKEIETCSRQKCFSNGRCVDKSIAVVELKNNGETCRSIVKHGTVFKMGNTTLADYQLPGHTTANGSAMPHKPENTKIENHKLLDKKKAAKQLTSKEKKAVLSEKVRYHETLVHTTNERNSTKDSQMKSSSKQIEILDSTPDKTKKKETSDPDWNKNAILGFNKKHNVDYLSIKKTAGDKIKGGALGNSRGKEGLEMLNGKGIMAKGSENTPHETDEKKSDTKVNTTSFQRNNKKTSKQKQSQKPGYSARVREETAVQVPGVYIILITVTLGGALLMTIIYVAIYYTVNVRGRSHDHSHDYEYGSGDENPFSVDTDSPWWNDDGDPAEKLLKSNKPKK